MVEENRQAQALVIILIVVGSAFIGGSVIVFNPFEDEIRISNAYFIDADRNRDADTLNLNLRNKANIKVRIDKIIIKRHALELKWTYNESIEIDANTKVTIIGRAENSTEELHFFDQVEITISYNEKMLSFYVRVSIEFSDFTFMYGNNMQSGFDYLNWTHFMFRNLNGYPIHGEYTNLKYWKKDRDPNELDKCLMCISRNCQFIVLNSSLFNFENFNLSVDIRRRDNDGVGVLLRYAEINGYPQFYILWQTLDHPMGDEEYLEEEAHLFNWTSEQDIIEFSKITLHHVKGYDAGNGVIGFNWTKLNSTYCPITSQWNNWRIKLDGTHFSYSYDLIQILTYNDLTLTNGSIGLASFESRESSFDNLYIW